MRRLIVVGPVPPPYHGVTVSTELVLANPELGRRFEIIHLDTSDHRPGGNVGKWEVRNAVEAVSAAWRLWRALRGEPGVVYLPVSQGLPGLARDTLLIRLASLRRWRIATHLRGSELAGVVGRQPAPVRAWLHAAFRRVDSMAVLGDSIRRSVEGLVPPERVAVVPNGTPDPGVNGNHAGRPAGLFLANLSRRKGPIEAMTAALEVIAEEPEARFVFAGELRDAEVARELQAMSARSDGRIELLPSVTGEQKLRLLSSSCFLLFPPREPEGHPRVVLEAMAAGLPVITTDRGAIAETVDDGVSGFVLPDPLPSALAERMLRLFRDEELRRAMSEGARERYLARYTQEAADRKLAEWLTDVAGAG